MIVCTINDLVPRSCWDIECNQCEIALRRPSPYSNTSCYRSGMALYYKWHYSGIVFISLRRESKRKKEKTARLSL
jgi:hypothetical protein